MAQLQSHTQVELRAACGSGRQIKHEPPECRALNYSHLQSNDNGLHVYMFDTSEPHFNGYFQLFFLFILGRKIGATRALPELLTVPGYKWQCAQLFLATP